MKQKNNAPKKDRRNWKYGSLSVAISLVFIAAVILVNVLVGVATDRFSIKFDMTSDSRFAISRETKDVLKEMDQNVTVYVFATETNYRSLVFGNEIVEMLYRYQAASDGKLTVAFIDPLRNPEFVNKYKSEVSTVSEYSLIVEDATGKFRTISMEDVYYWYDSTRTRVVGISLERRLTAALLWLESDVQPVAAILTGNGEIGYGGLVSLLTDSNYQVISLNLLTDEIPENVELIVISSPSTDYTPDEINKLDKYFAQYKRAIVSIGAESPSLPELEQFLGEWGISYGKSILLDSQYKIGNDYSAVASSPLSTSTDTLLNGITSYIIAPYSRPLTTLWASSDRFNGRITTPLLTTSTQSYAKPFVEGETISTFEREDGDVSGPFYTAVLTTQTTIVDNITVEGGILFLSSPYVYNESLLNTNSYGNMTLMSNVLGEFNKSGVKVNIKNKSFAAPELAVIGNQLTVILVLLALIPAALLIMGGVVWYRRKNR
ncbi:MAG TPA: GldG family protein [Clostridiales bacterium]|jgi:hypothetical protein|nr:GldG family protein [Clostridiales bacterium]